MRPVHVFIAVAVLLASSVAWSSELIDRVVAVVNRRVILQSEVESAARFQALLEGRSADSITSESLGAAMERLINEQLLFGEMADPNAYTLNSDQLTARLTDIRSQFPNAKSDGAWRDLLAKYGLSEEDFDERVKTQAEILRFIDVRLRPTVRVDSFAIEAYYHDEFLPKLRASGGGDMPLSQVSGRIEQILIEKRIDEMLKDWLRNLREQAEIRITVDSEAPVQSQSEVSGGGRHSGHE